MLSDLSSPSTAHQLYQIYSIAPHSVEIEFASLVAVRSVVAILEKRQIVIFCLWLVHHDFEIENCIPVLEVFQVVNKTESFCRIRILQMTEIVL